MWKFILFSNIFFRCERRNFDPGPWCRYFGQSFAEFSLERNLSLSEMFCQRSASNSQNITARQAAHSINNSKDGYTTATTAIIRGRIITWTIARTQWTVAKQLEMCVIHHPQRIQRLVTNERDRARALIASHNATNGTLKNTKRAHEMSSTLDETNSLVDNCRHERFKKNVRRAVGNFFIFISRASQYATRTNNKWCANSEQWNDSSVSSISKWSNREEKKHNNVF